MCQIIEEMRKQEREEVTQELTHNFVVRMINAGETSVEKMAQCAGLTTEEVEKIIAQEQVLI